MDTDTEWFPIGSLDAERNPLGNNMWAKILVFDITEEEFFEDCEAITADEINEEYSKEIDHEL